MIHSTLAKPRIIPYNGTGAWAEIDRLQELSASISLNREKIREIGRDGTVDWRKRIPTTNVTLRQLEYGNLEFYRKLANVSDATTDITLADFKTSMTDILCYKTDDDGTYLGTVWYPKLRTSGFSINIGDPQAMIERNFTLVGEDEITLQGNNEYFIYDTVTSSGSGSQTFSVLPPPVADPDASGAASGYFARVLRVRSGVTTELTYTTDYTYNSGTSILTVNSCSVGDVFKLYYFCDEYLSGTSIFTNNDTDPGCLIAEAASVYLYVSANNYLYKLQSVGIDVSFDRTDYFEIGNEEVVQRGVRDKTVRVTLGRILEAYTLEEVLRGCATDYGKIDPRKFGDDITLRVKLFTDADKDTFGIGFKAPALSPVSLDGSIPTQDYIQKNATLEGEDLTISSLAATIDA